MSNSLETLIRAGSALRSTPVALAPMSGVTDVVFRRIAARLGADYTVTEMVAAAAFTTGSEEARLRAEGAGGSVHVVQLAGRDPNWIAEAARLSEGAGATVIDLNMGCPAKKVVGGHGGAALLKDIPLAVRIIEAAVGAVNVPVTVKMRLGWGEGDFMAGVLACAAEQAGARLVTVHGRTRSQFYEGRADWKAIAAVRAATSLPVVANGDIIDLDDGPEALRQSGAAGLMIGRGAQGRPWMPGMLAAFLRTGRKPAPPSLAAQLDIACEHYLGLLDLMGRETGARHARKHLGWYLDAAEESCGGHIDAAARHDLLTCADPRLVPSLLRRAYEAIRWRVAA